MIDTAGAARFRQWSRDNPVEFALEVLGFFAWSKQRQVLESVRDHHATAVRSSHGVGKTAIAARVVLWFLAAYAPEALVVTTAPTWRQVRDLLWKEIAKAHARADGFFDVRPTDTRLEFGPDWYAVGLSTNQPENFQGYHAEHLLFVVDEASGVKQPIYEAAEGFLTAEHARVLLIGNPTQIGGEFHSAFHGSRALYNAIHVNVFDTPAFTGEEVPANVARALPSRAWQERMRIKYRVPVEHERGVDTDGRKVKVNPVYQVRVLGQFADQGERVVVPMYEVENAQARQLEGDDADWPRVVACDPARFGDDETVIAIRKGKQVRIWDVRQGQDTMATAGDLLRAANELRHPTKGKPVIVVDEIGLGAGVVDRLRELAREDPERYGFKIVAYSSAEKPAEENEGVGGYPNARSELWFEFAEDHLPELDLPVGEEGDELLEELCTPEYTIDSRGRRVVEAKDVTKERLGRSPDKADAVMMLFARKTTAGLVASIPLGVKKPGGSTWRS